MAAGGSIAAPVASGSPAAGDGTGRAGRRVQLDTLDLEALEGSALGRRYHVDTHLLSTRRHVLYQGLDLVARHTVTIAVARSSDDAEALLRVTDRVRSCRHPNLAGVLDISMTSDDIVFVVLEHHGGVPLAQALEDWKAQAWPWRRVAAIGGQLCSALGAYHACGIAHADVSPRSCMISWDEAGEPIVRLLAVGSASDDAGSTRARDDVRGVAAVLYAVLTGRAAEPDDTRLALPSTVRPGLPQTARELEKVIVRALSPRPTRGYPSAERMYDALRRAQNLDTRDSNRPIEVTGTLEIPQDPQHEIESPAHRDVDTPPVAGGRFGRAFGALTISLAMGTGLWLVTRPDIAAGPAPVADRTLAHAVVSPPASEQVEARTPAMQASAMQTQPVIVPPSTASAAMTIADDPVETTPQAFRSDDDDRARARPAPPPPLPAQRGRTHAHRRRSGETGASANGLRSGSSKSDTPGSTRSDRETERLPKSGEHDVPVGANDGERSPDARPDDDERSTAAVPEEGSSPSRPAQEGAPSNRNEAAEPKPAPPADIGP